MDSPAEERQPSGWSRACDRRRAPFPSWTRDGKWIQVVKGSAIVRVRVSDGHVERVTGLERVALVNVPWGTWIGLAPDDSPIALRATGATEVYALDVQWP